MTRVLFSGHDFQFISGYMDGLRTAGHDVLVDPWNWDGPVDLARAQHLSQCAEVVFCEWACANAAWHAKTKRRDQRLIVRAHLQELNEGFGHCIHDVDMTRVDALIFVADHVKNAYLADHPEVKHAWHIPNFVDPDRFAITEKKLSGPIVLGQLGTVRWRKRPDLSVAVLRRLLWLGYDALLFIKGDRPEQRPFMHDPRHRAEMNRFYALYDYVATDPLLAGRVVFETFSEQVKDWYGKICHILSPSDFECFHYAVADGVLSGCNPIVWDWEGARSTYPQDWIVSDVKRAAAQILSWEELSAAKRRTLAASRRATIEARYGKEVIFPKLSEAVFGSESDAHKE